MSSDAWHSIAIQISIPLSTSAGLLPPTTPTVPLPQLAPVSAPAQLATSSAVSSPARPATHATTPEPRISRPRRPRSTRGRSRSPHGPTPAVPPAQAWKSEKEKDVPLIVPRFFPARTPGVQPGASVQDSPLSLFKLFFSDSVVKTLCENTNKLAARNIESGKKYKWTSLTPLYFFKYLGLVVYMAILKLPAVADYWRQEHMFSVPFPGSLMPRHSFRVISWNLHMSDPAEDVINDRKKGTPEYDTLFRVRPLMDDIKIACKSFYQPRLNLSIDERMVATKAKTGMTQYMKAKPTKWGFKLFVLADSSNGYTCDFTVYTGKSKWTVL